MTGRIVVTAVVTVLLFRFCLQVKEMCRRELDRLDTEVKRSNTIIADYKQVGLDGRNAANTQMT